MSETKQPDTKKAEAKPTLYSFYVGKYDLTVQAANAQDAVAIAKETAANAKKQSKKEDK